MDGFFFILFLMFAISLFGTGLILPGILMLIIACKFLPDSNNKDDEK